MTRGRPKKKRIIQKEPPIKHFSPRGRRGRPGYVELPEDGYEAMRLTDFLGYSQKEAADSMGISQQTLSRSLKAARKVVSEGITLGTKIIIKPQKTKPKTKGKTSQNI